MTAAGASALTPAVQDQRQGEPAEQAEAEGQRDRCGGELRLGLGECCLFHVNLPWLHVACHTTGDTLPARLIHPASGCQRVCDMDRTATVALLDAWKSKRGVTSDNQAALALGISRQAVSRYRHGKAHADVEIAAKMAEELGLEVIEILAAIQADREIRPQAQAIWRRYGKPAFFSLLAGALVTVGGPGEVLGNVQPGSATVAKCEHTTPLCEVIRGTITERKINRWRRLAAMIRRLWLLARAHCVPGRFAPGTLLT